MPDHFRACGHHELGRNKNCIKKKKKENSRPRLKMRASLSSSDVKKLRRCFPGLERNIDPPVELGGYGRLRHMTADSVRVLKKE